MAVKKKYKPVFRGVKYITDKLLKNYPKKYPNRKAASEQAHSLVSQLKASKTKITFSAARKLLPKREIKHKKRVAPILDEGLIHPINYFNLTDYIKYISRMPNTPELLFESSLIPIGLEDLMAGFKYDYSDYFAPYVNYMNNVVAIDKEDGRYEMEFYVKCTEPTFSNNLKKWVSRIVSCDVDGVEQDYGFQPENIDFQPQEPIIIQQKPEKPQIKPLDEPKSEINDIIRIEQEKQRTEYAKQRTLIFTLYADGKISQELFESELKRLNNI